MKTLILGGTGLLGSEFSGISKDIALAGSKDVDLTNREATLEYFKKMSDNGVKRVIHAAAKVGGLKVNMEKLADFFDENARMNVNVLEASQRNSMNLVSVLSTCVYPSSEYIKYPLTEDQLHMGPPHDSNFGYAYAKRMLEVQTRAYRKQFGSKFISVIPNNMYGPNDNYHLEDGHVIPALIRKFHEAKILGYKNVDIWGSGIPLREFTFARDIAEIILWLAENYDSDEPINVGNIDQISIMDLAYMISKEVGYEGDTNFDRNKPDGQYQKPSCNEKLRSLGWHGKYTPLHEGLRETIKSFVSRYPNVRGVTI